MGGCEVDCMRYSLPGLAFPVALALALSAQTRPPGSPAFYQDVLPILQRHCQECHRPGQIAPMPLVTYEQTKSWARLLREDVRSKKMTPWVAHPWWRPFSHYP